MTGVDPGGDEKDQCDHNNRDTYIKDIHEKLALVVFFLKRRGGGTLIGNKGLTYHDWILVKNLALILTLFTVRDG